MHWIHWLMDWTDLVFSVTDPQRSWKIISSLLGWPQPRIHSYISIPLQKDGRGFQSAELLRLEWVQGPFSTGCGNLSLTTNLSSWEQELSASEGRALVGGAGGRSRSDSLGCDNPFYTWRWRCFLKISLQPAMSYPQWLTLWGKMSHKEYYWHPRALPRLCVFVYFFMVGWPEYTGRKLLWVSHCGIGSNATQSTC